MSEIQSKKKKLTSKSTCKQIQKTIYSTQEILCGMLDNSEQWILKCAPVGTLPFSEYNHLDVSSQFHSHSREDLTMKSTNYICIPIDVSKRRINNDSVLFVEKSVLFFPLMNVNFKSKEIYNLDFDYIIKDVL